MLLLRRKEDKWDTNAGHVAIIHGIVLILVVGYAQAYYFHLRKCSTGLVQLAAGRWTNRVGRPPQEPRPLNGLRGNE